MLSENNYTITITLSDGSPIDEYSFSGEPEPEINLSQTFNDNSSHYTITITLSDGSPIDEYSFSGEPEPEINLYQDFSITNILDLVSDTTPQLGGDLDGQGYKATNIKLPLQINSQTGTSYTLVLSDPEKVIEMDNVNPITLTVPPNSSVPFPIGTQIMITQIGTGYIDVQPGSGVTIDVHIDFILRTNGQYACAAIYKRSTNRWAILGNLE